MYFAAHLHARSYQLCSGGKVTYKDGFVPPEGSDMLLKQFFGLISDYNNKVNLTAITGERQFFIKHVWDSLAGQKYFPAGASVAEVGSGGGFPSLPLKICRPDLFFTEETPIHTSSPYSSSKAGADLLVLAYYRTFDLPVTVSRCSNNYGPYHFPEKLIPLMIANALHDKPLPVYGEGLNVRDWLYVEDHCKALDLIIHNGRVGEVYNIGGHNEMRNIDIVKLICRELGKPESLITYVTDRKGHDMRYAIDPTKIKNELGWTPETKFEDGIKKTIRWYLDNREWWETIINGEYRDYYERMYASR